MFPLRSWIELAKEKALPLLFASVAFSNFAFNATEQDRMARAIEKGRFRGKKPDEFDETFVNFDLPAIHRGLGKKGMVALIGLKATGKSTTLQHVVYHAENPFYIEISDDNLHRAIYQELRGGIRKLPWFLDGIRLDWGKTHKKVVTEVFEKVNERSQKPVRLGLDVVAGTKYLIEDAHISDMIQVATGKVNMQMLTNFDAKCFVKQVKYLCADRYVASALVASSEGLMFLSVQEPRLRKLLAKELSVEKSKEYLKTLGKVNVTDEVLTSIPRTFAKLKEYKEAGDKEAFVKKEMEDWVQEIKKTKNVPFKVKELYTKALQGPIDIDDIAAAMSGKSGTLGVDPEETFIQRMVKDKNIFTPRDGLGYELQFDCQYKAVKKVFDL